MLSRIRLWRWAANCTTCSSRGVLPRFINPSMNMSHPIPIQTACREIRPIFSTPLHALGTAGPNLIGQLRQFPREAAQLLRLDLGLDQLAFLTPFLQFHPQRPHANLERLGRLDAM